MNQHRYQLNKTEFIEEWSMSPATYSRRMNWIKENYPKWFLVYLPDHMIDIREYQKAMTFMAQQKWESKMDTHFKLRRVK